MQNAEHLTTQAIKAAFNDPAIILQVETVQKADYAALKTRAQVNAIKTRVLDYNRFINSSEVASPEQIGKPILEPKDDYMLRDIDWPTYLDQLNKIYLSQGFHVEREFCPALIAEEQHREESRKLMQMIRQYINLPKFTNVIQDKEFLTLFLTGIGAHHRTQQAKN